LNIIKIEMEVTEFTLQHKYYALKTDLRNLKFIKGEYEIGNVVNIFNVFNVEDNDIRIKELEREIAEIEDKFPEVMI